MNEYDSKYELYFSWWLKEAKEAGLVQSWKLKPVTYDLFTGAKYKKLESLVTKTKVIERSLLQPARYTPDFTIDWELFGLEVLGQGLRAQHHPLSMEFFKYNEPSLNAATTLAFSVIDVKAGPAYHKGKGSTPNSSDVRFPLCQKWTWANYGIYVEAVDVVDLFRKTWVPARYFMTDKSAKARKQNWPFVSIKDFQTRVRVKHGIETAF